MSELLVEIFDSKSMGISNHERPEPVMRGYI